MRYSQVKSIEKVKKVSLLEQLIVYFFPAHLISPRSFHLSTVLMFFNA